LSTAAAICSCEAQPCAASFAVDEGLPCGGRVGGGADRGEGQDQGRVVVAGLLAAGMDADQQRRPVEPVL
jgi:hypothetical protein